MIKDLIVSFRDNFKDKVKNPFLGTYALVWIIRNWDLIFTLFNFDKGTSLEDKLKIITSYLEDNPFFGGLVINVLYTFLFLIVIYFLLNVSRAIVNLYEKKLKPWVYKLTDNSSIVLKEDYERLRNERDNLLVRINNEREEKAKVENELKTVQDKISKINIANTISSPTIEEEKEISEAFHVSLYNELKDEGLVESFQSVSMDILKGNEFSRKDSNMLEPLIRMGLIKYKSAKNSVDRLFELTTDGTEVLKILRINKND